MGVKTAVLREFFAAHTLGSPQNATGFVLWKLVHRYQRAMDRALLPLELTHLQFTTLAMVGWLNQGAGPVTQGELSRQADIQRMQISQTLTALEIKGWVSRTQGTVRGRAKFVEITPAGFKTLKRAMPMAIDVQRRLFGPTGAPGGHLLSALQKIYDQADEQIDVTGIRP